MRVEGLRGTPRPGLPPSASAAPAFRAFETKHFTEMCSGSEAGSYLRLIDFVNHSTLGLGVIKKKKKIPGRRQVMRREYRL